MDNSCSPEAERIAAGLVYKITLLHQCMECHIIQGIFCYSLGHSNTCDIPANKLVIAVWIYLQLRLGSEIIDSCNRDNLQLGSALNYYVCIVQPYSLCGLHPTMWDVVLSDVHKSMLVAIC